MIGSKKNFDIKLCLLFLITRFRQCIQRRNCYWCRLFVTAPRECIICGDLAVFECKECYNQHGAGLNTIAFCEGCKDMVGFTQVRLSLQSLEYLLVNTDTSGCSNLKICWFFFYILFWVDKNFKNSFHGQIL